MEPIKVIKAASSEVYENKFRWIIPNFNMKKIYSEKISLSDEIDCTVMLISKLIPGNINGPNIIRNFFTVFFTKALPVEECNTYFQFYAKSCRNGDIIAFQDFKKIMLNAEGFTADRNYLTSRNAYRFLGKNHTLDFELSFILKDTERFKSLTLRNFEKERSDLARNYAEVYKDIKYSDINLICANNEVVPAHKAILASRSPVFAKILTDEVTTYDMGENVCKEALMEFLRFLYCDTVDTVTFDPHAIEIWQLAIKFEISEFMKLCLQDIFHGSKILLHAIHQKVTDLTIQRAMKTKNFVEIAKHIRDLHKLVKDK